MFKLFYFLLSLCLARGVASISENSLDTQQNIVPISSNLQWGLGVLAVVQSSVYRGKDNDFRLLPALNFQYKDLSFRGIQAQYQLLHVDGIKLDLALRPGLLFKAYEAKDSRDLRGMRTRRLGLDLGVQAQYKLRFINFKTSLFQDIGDIHRGHQAIFTIGSALPLHVVFRNLPFILWSLEIGPHYLHSNIATHLYGVKVSESITNRPTYFVKDTLTTLIQSNLIYKINDMWSFSLIYSMDLFPNEIYQSSIVSKTQSWRSSVILTRSF